MACAVSSVGQVPVGCSGVCDNLLASVCDLLGLSEKVSQVVSQVSQLCTACDNSE